MGEVKGESTVAMQVGGWQRRNQGGGRQGVSATAAQAEDRLGREGNTAAVQAWVETNRTSE